MPPKVKLPAPIDRPLSRAYLREFTGWSTAFPPGLSDPTSLRIMENLQINRDGSIKVRPGLKYLSYATPPVDDVAGVGITEQCVGTHEAFYLNDGTKAYLFAVRETDLTVGFRVLVLSGGGATVRHLTDAGVDFSVPQGEPALRFTAATTYVKYLQIDNKIFALSNAGETMRLFTVGETKTAKRLNSIDRPQWTVADKLNVVKPAHAWITDAGATAVRTNIASNPNLDTADFIVTDDTAVAQTMVKKSGVGAVAISSKPVRTNLIYHSTFDNSNTAPGWWTAGANTNVLTQNSNALRVHADSLAVNTRYYLNSGAMPVVAGKTYRIKYTVTGSSGSGTFQTLRRWYNAGGTQIGADVSVASTDFTAVAPAGATQLRIFPSAIRNSTNPIVQFDIKDAIVCLSSESSAFFSGASGTGYFWTGTVNNSPSVYQPVKDVYVALSVGSVGPGTTYSAGLQVRGTVVRSVAVGLQWYRSDNSIISTDWGSAANDSTSAWTRYTVTAVAPTDAASCAQLVKVAAVARGETHYIDEKLVEAAGSAGVYFDGDTTNTSTKSYAWLPLKQGSTETTQTAVPAIPSGEVSTANTLISSTPANNQYSVGYFYTFENEIGESSASQVTVVKVQRSWSAWKWETTDGSGNPSGTATNDPTLAADQLVAIMPSSVYSTAKVQGALKWNLYMLTWSDQDSVPVDGILLASKAITTAGTYATEGWIRHTPANADAGFSASLPNINNRHNYSEPPSPGQGLVAADRMILVDDPTAQAVIRWTSNLQGEYGNLTSSKGGGYKTLTSGNLYVPVAVKLWQNPQSADTITILCQGLDGMHQAYYMAPASVAQQSEQVTVMGFEETTATPGTTSPYGCEILNNALYHPLDEQLMKSTASNYNISHKSQTDMIEDRWSALANKQRIVSSVHDNRLYYLVDNPYGEPVEPGCMGNEIWVYDIASDTGTWSRWQIQACSLRRIEYEGKVRMSVVRPDGIYYLDIGADSDDVVDAESHTVSTRYIPWRLETNTQGANRAHDAWCHLQQLEVDFGNLQGTFRYGIRSHDLNGKDILIEKQVTDNSPRDLVDFLPFDIKDHLAIRKDIQEWFFFASSIVDEEGNNVRSAGQIDAVQYRYTPSTVNTGYQYGEVETFEYGRAAAGAATNTLDGVPAEFHSRSRP